MPTYEHLMLRTGQVIVEEWYDKLVKALNAIANESSVTYDGVIKRSLSPEVDLLMNLGEAGKRLLSGFFGYGYFTYEIRVGSTVRVLPDKIIFPDLSVQTRSADNIVAEHEAKVTGIHGVGANYIAKTSRSDQLPSWDDIPDKPSTFPPSAHADTHKDGGSDEVVGIAKMGTTLPSAGIAGRFFIKTDTLELYYDDGTNWIKIGKLAGLDLDAHASRHNYGGADPITDLDASQITSGVLSADRIPKILPDKLDAIDTPSDGEVPSYNAAQGKFEWVPAGAAEAGLDPELDGYIWIHTLFESRDGFEYAEYGSGSAVVESTGFHLSTGDTPDSYANFYLHRSKYITYPSWKKERIMKLAFLYPTRITGDAYSWITMGDEPWAGCLIGLKLNEYGNNEVYAIVFDGTNSQEIDTGLDTQALEGYHVLEIRHYPADRAEIWLDGSQLVTITANLPAGEGSEAEYLATASVRNRTDALNYELFLIDLLFVQKP